MLPRSDLGMLFGMRALRLFAYGFVAVVLVLYLADLGFGTRRIGLLIALTYLGDAAISLWLTTRADRWGRRRVLQYGSALMIASGGIFALSRNFWVLAVAGTIGVISPSGNEVGPFLAIEQACLAQVVGALDRTRVFAWYHVAGFTAGAVGAAAGGLAFHIMQDSGWTSISSYRALCWLYAAGGIFLLGCSRHLNPSVEAPGRNRTSQPLRTWHGVDQSRSIVTRLGILFAVDSFAGGFIVQSFVAYWFLHKFGVSVSTLGGIFFGTNLLSGLSALLAVPIAKRIGLVNTMVWTHLPSNIVLLLVPLMPTVVGAVSLLLLRNLISQMDVPTRLSYVNSLVPAEERSAANGITATARQIGLVFAPLAVGPLLANFRISGLLFWIAGGLKIGYDLVLWRTFARVKPPEEN